MIDLILLIVLPWSVYTDNHLDADMAMIRIQALEWVQGQIQDLILNYVTTDWLVYYD